VIRNLTELGKIYFEDGDIKVGNNLKLILRDFRNSDGGIMGYYVDEGQTTSCLLRHVNDPTDQPDDQERDWDDEFGMIILDASGDDHVIQPEDFMIDDSQIKRILENIGNKAFSKDNKELGIIQGVVVKGAPWWAPPSVYAAIDTSKPGETCYNFVPSGNGKLILAHKIIFEPVEKPTAPVNIGENPWI